MKRLGLVLLSLGVAASTGLVTWSLLRGISDSSTARDLSLRLAGQQQQFLNAELDRAQGNYQLCVQRNKGQVLGAEFLRRFEALFAANPSLRGIGEFNAYLASLAHTSVKPPDCKGVYDKQVAQLRAVGAR